MRRFSALTLALGAFALAALGTAVMHSGTKLPLASKTAVRDALRNRTVTRNLRGVHWTRVSVSPVDAQLERVSFYAGPRIVAEVAMHPDGSVRQTVNFTRLSVPYGDWLAYEPALMFGLLLLFVLTTAVVPAARIRNLDVLALASFVAPVVLLQHRYQAASVVSVLPGMCYFMVRCACRGLARSPSIGPPATPLLDVLTARWTAAERVRILRLLLAALALMFVMVGVSSPNAVDVIYGVMEGATKVIHGVLPYGHMPGDVIHGDTYPILSYALYAPLARFAPVSSTWSSVDAGLGVAVAAALLSAAAVYKANLRRGRPGRGHLEELAGLRAALALLSFPPLLISVSTGTTDIVLAAMLVLAIVLWRRPAVSSTLIAAAGWFKLAPFALVPIWLAPLRGRRLWAASAAMVAVSGAMIGILVALGGTRGPSAMVHAVAFQLSRGSPQSVWSVLGIEALQPIAQAAVIGLVIGAAVRLRRDPRLALDRTRIAALSGAVLIGLELAADYWAFLYLAWVVPLLVLGLPEPAAETVGEPVASRAKVIAAPLPA